MNSIKISIIQPLIDTFHSIYIKLKKKAQDMIEFYRTASLQQKIMSSMFVSIPYIILLLYNFTDHIIDLYKFNRIVNDVNFGTLNKEGMSYINDVLIPNISSMGHNNACQALMILLKKHNKHDDLNDISSIKQIQNKLYDIAINSNAHAFIKIVAINKIIALDLKNDIIYTNNKGQPLLNLLESGELHTFINHNSDLTFNFKINFLKAYILYTVHIKNYYQAINMMDVSNSYALIKQYYSPIIAKNMSSFIEQSVSKFLV